jgi:pyruvate kinase
MLGVPAVAVLTTCGFSARIVSSQRPGVPILALTDVVRTFNQLALVWGVISELVPASASYDEMMRHGRDALIRRGLAKSGEQVIVTAGVPFDVPGTTNLLMVETV